MLTVPPTLLQSQVALLHLLLFSEQRQSLGQTLVLENPQVQEDQPWLHGKLRAIPDTALLNIPYMLSLQEALPNHPPTQSV